jgi:ABC-type glycerol-3-phosphate transport system substrate-binding protein
MLGITRHLKLLLLFCLSLLCLLAACNPAGDETTPVQESTETITAPQPVGSTTLPTIDLQAVTIWIPPSLGPDTEAGQILSNHLAIFDETNPQIDIHLRVKDGDGVSGILETLTSASLAAPSILPDIVVLNPTALHTAALKGLIIPINEIVEAPQIPEWYEYSISAAYVDDSFVGIPFSSEASAFAYRRDAYEAEPRKWADLLGAAETFLIPLGKSGPAFTLLLYKEMGGKLMNQNGYPTIDTEILTDIFEFYASSNKAGILPLFTLQLQSPEDSWPSLQQGFGNSAIVPLEKFIDGSLDENYLVTPWPTRSGLGVVPTETLTWAVVKKNNIQHDLLSQVLQWLQFPAFSGELAFSMGSLPVTSSAMDYWPAPDQVSTISRLIRVASAEPDTEELATFGNSIRAAIAEVMNDRDTPVSAAKNVLDQISGH